jgi:hypothetical protein
LIGRHPFAAWVLVGIPIGLALTPLFVITLPLAVVGAILVRRRTREPDDMLGVVCGVGLVLLMAPTAAIRLAGAAALLGGIAAHALIGRLGRR